MLKVKSFQIGDEVEINELLHVYPMSKGSQILVSNGEICIPIEDGEQPNNEWVARHLTTQLNDTILSKELVNNNIAGLILMRDKYSKVQKVFEQYDNTIIQNRKQIEEYDTLIEALTTRIKELKAV